MSKVLKIAGVSILALGLVLGTVLPVGADSGSTSPQASDVPPKVLRGKVVSIEENQEFVIQSGEQELPILVDEDTKYFKLCVPGRIIALARHRVELRHQNQEGIGTPAQPQTGFGLQNQGRARALAQHQMRHQNQIPQLDDGNLPEPKPPKLNWLRSFGQGAEFSDIEVGDRVVVQAVPSGDRDNSYVAKRVLIIKPTTYARVNGTIDAVSSEAKTITITTNDGEVPLSYNEGTVFILKGITQMEGQSAYVIYDSENNIAKRVVVHQLVQ